MSTRTLDFFEPRVRFGMRRPAGWHFARPAWTPGRDPLPLAQIDWAARGRTPFLSLVRDSSRARQPWPTLRVCCHPLGAFSTTEVRRALEQVQAVCRELEDCEVLACSFDAMIGGQRAAHVRFRYTLAVRERRRTERWRVLARSYLVFAPGLAFTIGAVSGAEERGFDDNAFSQALASVRIRPVDELLPARPRSRAAQG